MVRKLIKRCAIALAAWLPFFAIWLLVAMSFARDRFSAVMMESLSAMGSAGLLGLAVWYVCQRWPWPLGFKLNFYLLQIFFAMVYGIAWTASIYGVESLRVRNALQGFWSWAVLGRQTLMGVWFYAVFAGISHAVQTRNRLHEKETLAARAEALAANAVHHAIAIRPEGGSIWIKCSCSDGRLQVTVRDDGPGHGSDPGASHQLGLRSLRERLQAAYGSSAELRVYGDVGGFEAGFIIPSCGKSP